jgi:Cu-Zn family superoxide dismutase
MIFFCCSLLVAAVAISEEEKKVTATAIIMGNDEDSPVSGTVNFTEVEGGVEVIANLSGVEPAGKHGIHIHMGGSCGDGGKAAGGHFNPAKAAAHGSLVNDGYDKVHAGDLGNIEIDQSGKGVLFLTLPGLSITDENNSIVGHAVIIKEREDDFSQPDGNAGNGIGCGTINLNG